MIRLDSDKIKEIIPHREPMLLIDEITIEDDNVIKGRYLFTGNEWFFQGHYPNNPIVPGVILCEIMAQTSCGLLANEIKGKTPYLISIINSKFRKVVKPKDELSIKATLDMIKGPFHYINSKAYVNDNLCAECKLSFLFR